MALLSGTTLIFVSMLPVGIIIASLGMLLRNVLAKPNEYGYQETQPFEVGSTVASLIGMLFGIVLLVLIIGAFA